MKNSVQRLSTALKLGDNMEDSSGDSRILLVEGPDDEHVVKQLWSKIKGEEQPFEIKQTGGISNLLETLVPQMRVRNRKALGVIVDADDYPERRLQSIMGRLETLQLPVPDTLNECGTIIDVPDVLPKLGVWIMPDNCSSGDLEAFIQGLIPPQDVIWPRAEQYVDSIPESERPFKSTKELHAKIHAWLAVRKVPRKMGAAIGAGDLNKESPQAKKLVEWLQNLFA